MCDLDWYFVLNSVFTLVFLASDRANFQNNCLKTNEGRHILSPVQIFDKDSSFWQYKVYVDICTVSLEKRHQRTVGSHVNARLEHLFLAFENN